VDKDVTRHTSHSLSSAAVVISKVYQGRFLTSTTRNPPRPHWGSLQHSLGPWLAEGGLPTSLLVTGEVYGATLQQGVGQLSRKGGYVDLATWLFTNSTRTQLNHVLKHWEQNHYLTPHVRLRITLRHPNNENLYLRVIQLCIKCFWTLLRLSYSNCIFFVSSYFCFEHQQPLT
jgi:hypothetical protein